MSSERRSLALYNLYVSTAITHNEQKLMTELREKAKTPSSQLSTPMITGNFFLFKDQIGASTQLFHGTAKRTPLV